MTTGTIGGFGETMNAENTFLGSGNTFYIEQNQCKLLTFQEKMSSNTYRFVKIKMKRHCLNEK